MSSRKDGFGDRMRYRIHGWCDVVELALAVIVGLVLIYTGICYMLNFSGILSNMEDTSGFQIFLHNIFNLVVGIEFIKMLLKPHVKNVIDVLIFLVARHLILSPGSPGGILICVLCIILLYGFLFFIKYMRARSAEFEQAVDSDFVRRDETYVENE